MTMLSRVGALAGTFVVLIATGAAAQTAKSKPVTVTGRVVDNVCMLGMGQTGEGPPDLYEAPGGQKVLAIKEVQAARAGGGQPRADEVYPVSSWSRAQSSALPILAVSQPANRYLTTASGRLPSSSR